MERTKTTLYAKFFRVNNTPTGAYLTRRKIKSTQPDAAMEEITAIGKKFTYPVRIELVAITEELRQVITIETP